MRTWVLGVAVALAGAAGVAAWAGPPAGGLLGLPLHGRMLESLLDKVNASDDQRSQIRRIAQSTAADLKAQREAGRSVKDQALSLFTQTTVDANAAEALRQQTMAQHDQASRRLLQAMLDVSRVLSPEQRKTLADELAKRRSMMERHHRERRELDGASPTR